MDNHGHRNNDPDPGFDPCFQDCDECGGAFPRAQLDENNLCRQCHRSYIRRLERIHAQLMPLSKADLEIIADDVAYMLDSYEEHQSNAANPYGTLE